MNGVEGCAASLARGWLLFWYFLFLLFLLFGAITATIRADTPTKALQVASCYGLVGSSDAVRCAGLTRAGGVVRVISRLSSLLLCTPRSSPSSGDPDLLGSLVSYLRR